MRHLKITILTMLAVLFALPAVAYRSGNQINIGNLELSRKNAPAVNEPDAKRKSSENMTVVAEVIFSDMDEFPYEILGYRPEIIDGVLTIECASVKLGLYLMDNLTFEPNATYGIKTKIKGSEAGSIKVLLGSVDGWLELPVSFTTDWEEVTTTYSPIDNNGNPIESGAAVIQTTGYSGVLEIEWIQLLKYVKSNLNAGDDFEYEGINYTVLDAEAKTCAVGRNVEASGNVVIPAEASYDDTAYSVVGINDNAFENCHDITGITLPNGLTSIGFKAFYDCSGLSDMTLPNSLTTIGDEAFEGCIGLTALTLPESVTTIGDVAFSGCSGLTELTLPSNLTAIGEYVFAFCSGLTELTLPNSITSIGDYVFYRCSGLSSLTLPAALKSIGNNAFYDCTALAALTFPDGLTNIGDNAFEGCAKLETLTFPEGLTTIGREAFYKCTGITEITLPGSITGIGDYAFNPCPITKVTYYAETPVSVGSIFTNTVYEDALLTMPNATLEVIQSTEPWNRFERIVAKDITIGSDLNAGDNFEYEGIIYTVIDPEAKTCAVGSNPEASGEIAIPAEAYYATNNYKVVRIDDGAFWYCNSLTSVALPEGLMSIGDNAFSGCGSLTGVTLPKGLTTIGGWAFDGCIGLTDVTLPDELTTIGDGTFRDCSGLTSVTFPEGLTIIGGTAFERCSGLTSLTLPKGLTTLGAEAFRGCSGLTSVTFPEGLTTIGGGVFRDCIGLTSMIFPEGLTTIEGSAFSDCTGLASLTFPEGLTTIEDNAFERCSGLTRITLPNSLTILGNGAFRDCSALTDVTFPEGLTTIGYETFQRCSGLTRVTLSNSITTISDRVFVGCSLITNVTYNSEDPISADQSIFDDIVYEEAILNMPNATLATIQATEPWNLFKNIVAKESPGLNAGDNFEYEGIIYTVIDPEAKTCAVGRNPEASGNIEIPSEAHNDATTYIVVGVVDYAFEGCSGLTSVTLPEGLTTIGGYALAGCSGLTSVTLPEGLTAIEEATFWGCSSLTSVTLPEGLTVIEEGAFWGCGLTSVTLPEGLTTIGNNAFADCIDLTSVTLPEGLTTIGNSAFADCIGLTSVTLPEGLTTIGDSAFADCSGLTSVTILEALTTIGGYVFANCISLTSVTLPAGLTTIGEAAFYGCISLTSVTLPEALTTIGENAFYGCISLTSVTLPEALTTIEVDVFTGCAALISITYNAQIPISSSLSIFDATVYENATLNMPNALLADIQATEPWNQFKHIVAKDGSIGSALNVGDEFEYEGLVYSVLDTENKTCRVVRPIDKDNLEGELVIPSKAVNGSNDYTVTEIGDWSFYMTKISSVTFPESLIIIDHDAFASCVNLTSVVFPDALTIIESWAFLSCDNLESVTFPASLIDLAPQSFTYCGKLQNITYYASNPIEAASNVFGWEEGIDEDDIYSNATLNMPNATLADIQATVPWNQFKHIVAKDGSIGFGLNAGDEFEYEGIIYTVIDPQEMTCKTKSGGEDVPGNLWSGELVIPEIVSYSGYEYKVTEIGRMGFFNCGDLTSLSLPESITIIGPSAFQGCSALTTLTLPIELKSIEEGGFQECTGLTTLTLPEGIDMVGNSAFLGCTGLTKLILPSDLGAIIYHAFWNCPNLTNITYYAEIPVSTEIIFDEIVYERAVLDMPNATLEATQATETWNRFKHIVAKDGSIGFGLNAGDDFEYNGLVYTVLNSEELTCKTKDGIEEEGVAGNTATGNLVIPQRVSDGENEYSVVEIGQYGFAGSDSITSVTLPATIENVGTDAFADCKRLTSLVWNPYRRMKYEVVTSIGNPNLLVYVDSLQFAPVEMRHNVVELITAQYGETYPYDGPRCERLVIEPNYPFHPIRTFVSLYSTMTKEFTQTTPIGGCAGWETIVLPFDATSVAVNDARGELTPFALVTNYDTQYPYWLYEADSESEWKEAVEIKAGVPYLISMPNSEEYAPRYRISGPVTFSNPNAVTITPATAAPYSVTWASGHQFRSLWLPLDAEEAENAMGLNVGIDDLTNDEGELLLPGSAFHVDVEPRPLEAYVTRQGTRKSLPVMGGQSHVALLEADNALSIMTENGTIYITGSSDRQISIFRVDGVCVKSFELKAGESCKVEGLAKGIYIVAGHKVIMK